MNNNSLYKIGGLSTFLAVAILAGLDIAVLLSFDLGSTFIPIFSIFIFLYTIFLVAGFDYISKYESAFSKIGGTFGVLLVVILLVEVAALGADQIYLSSTISSRPDTTTESASLFTSSHTLAIWLHAIWMASWGFALNQPESNHKNIGVLMIVFAGVYVIYYILYRLGSFSLAEAVHIIGHVPLLVSHVMLGRIWLRANET